MRFYFQKIKEIEKRRNSVEQTRQQQQELHSDRLEELLLPARSKTPTPLGLVTSSSSIMFPTQMFVESDAQFSKLSEESGGLGEASSSSGLSQLRKSHSGLPLPAIPAPKSSLSSLPRPAIARSRTADAALLRGSNALRANQESLESDMMQTPSSQPQPSLRTSPRKSAAQRTLSSSTDIAKENQAVRSLCVHPFLVFF